MVARALPVVGLPFDVYFRGCGGQASLSVVECMKLRGWGSQRGFTLRDMYLTVGFLVGILKCIISKSLILRFYNVMHLNDFKSGVFGGHMDIYILGAAKIKWP